MNNNRVVITGIGGICSLGSNVNEIWQSILDYKMGYEYIPSDDPSIVSKFFGVVEDPLPSKNIPKKILKLLPRFAKLGMIASLEAMESAFGKNPCETLDKLYSPFDRGIIFGTGWGGVDSTIENNDLYVSSGFASPFSTIFSMHSVLSGAASMLWNMRGYQNTHVAACATGNIAIGDAYELIKNGKVKCMLAGGSESIRGRYNVWSVDILGALSKEQKYQSKACCPFDSNRSGFILSEGSAAVVLETLDSALERGAHIYGEITGYANCSDAFDITAPADDLMGRYTSLIRAMEEAQLDADDIDYINAHGTSTPLNDLNETKTLKKVFHQKIYNIPISSTKSYTGHLIGAAGAMETIFCLQTLKEKIAPATINLNDQDPDCDLDYIPNKHRRLDKVNNVLNINYGFGGTNSSLIIRGYPEC